MDPWRVQLDALLAENDDKPVRERLTLVQLYEELRGLDHDGSHATVRRYVIGWSQKRTAMTADAYVPLSFAPGEAYQFDWSHETITLQGLPMTFKAPT